MHPYTKKQKAAFERGKWLIRQYEDISPEHNNPKVNKSVIVGDMIADLIYTMTKCYQYPKSDIEGIKFVALESISFDHNTMEPK